jgi:hypothetical protein
VAEGPAEGNCVHHICAAAILCTLLPQAAQVAQAQGYPGYPNSIMTSERGFAVHRHPGVHRGTSAPETAPVSPAAGAASQPHHPSLLGREKFIAKLHRRGLYAVRGSSGSVLPTPLPKTQLIPPEGSSALTLPLMQQEQGPTRIPGTAHIIPNVPHGAETFQDRASHCAFQSGLYGVPRNLSNRYIGACVQ